MTTAWTSTQSMPQRWRRGIKSNDEPEALLAAIDSRRHGTPSTL